MSASPKREAMIPPTSDQAAVETRAHPDAPLRHQGPEITAGTRLGAYEVIRLLGRGGMGSVFLARDPRLGRRVAIKLMKAAQPELAERLLMEARATARCHHENIVVIYEVGEFEGHPFLVLEYLEGMTLAERLRSTITPQRITEIACSTARALAHAHETGIVHRDLKPANIFITRTGAVKVLDFGLAKAAADARRTSKPDGGKHESIAPLDVSITQDGHTVGTLLYMAPEQLRGEEVGVRADVWSLGVVIYEALTGRHLIDSATPIRLAALANGDLPLPDFAAQLPADLAAVVSRCCVVDRKERVSAGETATALEAALSASARAAMKEGACPYPGLTTFGEAHAQLFFGRLSDTRRVLARLEDNSLVVLTGASGVGKSSLIYAGLVPSLHASDEWTVIRTRPGRRPLANLAAAGGSDLAEVLRTEPGALGSELRQRALDEDTNVLLIVDQLEELYTLCTDADERRAFTAAIRAVADDVASPVRVVASMRSDFVDRVSDDPAFLTQVNEGLLLVGPLQRNELSAALTEPAALAGYRFEGSFVDEMVDALLDTPGALPLMQFVAVRLWEHRDRSRQLITEASYRAMGGIEGALAAHADAVFAELPREVVDEAPAILLRLVTSEGTRDVAPLDALLDQAKSAAQAQVLIDALVRARLLVAQSDASGTTIEIAHEALISRWPRLSQWIEDDRENLRVLRSVRDAARQWEAAGRPAGLLWNAEPLAEAKRWRERQSRPLAKLEEAFLQEAIAQESSARRTQRRWVIGVMALLAALAIGALVAMFLVSGAERETRRQAERARDQAERALSAEHRATRQATRAEQAFEERRRAEQRAESSEQQVAERDEDLAATNMRLQAALSEQERATDLARRAQQQAEREASRAQDAEQQLRGVLREREDRLSDLERRLSKISTELR
ncbi:MAG: protein kinase [Myxococcota bacterium]